MPEVELRTLPGAVDLAFAVDLNSNSPNAFESSTLDASVLLSAGSGASKAQRNQKRLGGARQASTATADRRS